MNDVFVLTLDSYCKRVTDGALDSINVARYSCEELSVIERLWLDEEFVLIDKCILAAYKATRKRLNVEFSNQNQDIERIVSSMKFYQSNIVEGGL